MLTHPRRSRPRPRRRVSHQLGLGTETLELRRLMVAPPIDVAAGLVIASGLPLPGLATGQGLTTTAQSLPSTAVTVAPASVAMPVAASFVPLATGPATTLSPLMTDSETANATASEVARPTPGTSDRISVVLAPPEIIDIPHLYLPDPVAIFPGPEIEPLEPAPLIPVAKPPATPPVPLAPPQEATPLPAPQASAEAVQKPLDLAGWDAALGLVVADTDPAAPITLAARSEGVLAAGVLLAAWSGWKYGPRSAGRSRRRPLAWARVVAGPGPETR